MITSKIMMTALAGLITIGSSVVVPAEMIEMREISPAVEIVSASTNFDEKMDMTLIEDEALEFFEAIKLEEAQSDFTISERDNLE